MLEGMVLVKKEEYKELLDESRFLHALQAAGVDNWEGYSYAYDLLEEWDSEVNK